MKVVFTQNADCEPASTEAVDEFERTHGIKLPTDYRSFLLSSPGGSPTSDICSWGTNGDVVGWVYGLHEGEEHKRLSAGISEFSDHCRIRGFDNRELEYLPVAISPGANFFLIKLRGPDAGAIYFFDHERNKRDPLIRISNSFSKWLADLKEN